MNIGTAKPNNTILNRYKHHCIDLVEPSEHFDTKQYTVFARACITDISNRNKMPIIVGGTGFYIKSLIYPLFEGPGRDQNIRNDLYQIASEKGNDFLYEQLKNKDYQTAIKININDTKRIVRALEVYYSTGKPISYFHRLEETYPQRKNGNNDFCIIGLTMNRENLYKRINDRVDQIIKKGLIEEVEDLTKKYNNINSFIAMQGLGYKQILSYLNGEISRYDAIEIIKRKTRNFAKRQLSWFKNQINIDYWIDLDQCPNKDNCINEIIQIMQEEGYQ